MALSAPPLVLSIPSADQDVPRRASPEEVGARRVPVNVAPLSERHDARLVGGPAGTPGYTTLKSSAIDQRHATRSADTQSAFRTLTGWRPVPVDESASNVDSGVL